MPDIQTQTEAKFWKVSRRAIQRWVKQGLPVRDRVALAKVLVDRKTCHISDSTRAVAQTVLATLPAQRPASAPSASSPPPEHITAPDTPSSEHTLTADELDKLADLDPEEALRYCQKRLAHAIALTNKAEIVYWEGRVAFFSEQKRKNEIHAQKMGLQSGEVLSREAACDLTYALTFWFAVHLEQTADQLAKKLVGSHQEYAIHDIITRHFADHNLLGTFSKAARVQAELRLPHWAWEAVEQSVKTFVMPGPSEEDQAVFKSHLESIQLAASKALAA